MRTGPVGQAPGDDVDRLESGGWRWRLEREQTLIGRFDDRVGAYPEVDLTPLDPGLTVSRRHAVVERRPDGATFRDLGSANGSAVDGRPAPSGQSVPLQDGSVVQVGDVRLAFCRAAAPASREVPAARGSSEPRPEDLTGTLLGRARPDAQTPAGDTGRGRRGRRR